MADLVRVVILGLVIAMGLRAMGLANDIVNMAFGLTLGAAAIAFALSFGIGGRDGGEVRGFGKSLTAPQKVKVYNPAFDVTGHQLITAIVTEAGVIRPPFKRNIKKAFSG